MCFPFEREKLPLPTEDYTESITVESNANHMKPQCFNTRNHDPSKNQVY